MNRSRHHTGWAGALAVAAELSRRGYDAAITLGNTPALDLICASPSGKPFTVQVKSLSTWNWILIQKTLLDEMPRDNLFFAVVLVPSDFEKPFEFHILTHAEACDSYRQQRKVKKDGTPYKPGMDGLAWGDVKPHKNRWDKLPQ
jgi:hypothetical protein